MQDSQNSVIRWLDEVAALAGIPATFDDTGAVDIELVSGAPMRLELDEQAQIMLMSADLFSVKAADRSACFELAMRLNLEGQGTGGASLGWDAQREMLVLSALTPTALLDEPGFLGVLSGFISLVDEFRKGLPQPESMAANMTPASPMMVRA